MNSQLSLGTRHVLGSALRFAMAIVIADAVVWWLFRGGTPVVMGSFAVICLLYFLNYEGSTSERLVGYTSAAVIGAGAVTLGSILAGPLWLAVLGAFIVSFSFAYARVLRGYVARASVGLQGAFFLPLMANVGPGQVPHMIGSWLIGSAIAVLAGLLILPNRRSGIIIGLLSQWLASARDATASQTADTPDPESMTSLTKVTHRLSEQSHSEVNVLGAVSNHDRAIADMVNGTQWGTVAFKLLNTSKFNSAPMPDPTRSLLTSSAEAFDSAERALTASIPPQDVPNLAAIREEDLRSLPSLTDEQLQQHYPARLISILAMRMLWLAGQVRGIAYPSPNLGSSADRRPLSLLQLNLGWGSVWFVNALRTGIATAACVLLVREMGLDHGLWVVLAALCVTQVSFSASSGGYSSLRLALGAMAGVALASMATLFPLPHLAFVILLPVLAFAAVIAAQRGPFLAQAFYTPFALTNLAAIQWTSDRDLEIARIENITLGVVVAAAFALAVYPFGLTRQLTRQMDQAEQSSHAYLITSIALARGIRGGDAAAYRQRCIRSVTQLESTLSASAVRSTLSSTQERTGQRADVLARDRVIGADACVDLARQRSESPGLAHVADVFADWWESSPLLDPTPADHAQPPQ